MIITGPLVTEMPNQLPSNGAPLEATADADGAAFSALLLLILVAPQVQGFSLGMEKQQPSDTTDGSVSLSCPGTPNAVSFFTADDGSTVADCAVPLAGTEATLTSKNNLQLDFQPDTNTVPMGLPVQQDNTDRTEGIVLSGHKDAGGTYAGVLGSITESAAISEAPAIEEAEKSIVDSKNGFGRLFSPPAREGAKIAGFDGQRLNLPESETPRADRLNVSSSVSHRSLQPMTVQDQNLMLFEANGKKSPGEEMKNNQNPSAQHFDLSLPVSSIPGRVEERAMAGGSAAFADWSPVINRVAGEIISSVRHNKHEAFINLEPPELGGIKIAISLEGDRVHARILAEAHESGRLIENHVAELKQALQLQSLDLVDLRVDSGSSWSGARSDQGQSFRQGFDRQQEWRDGNSGFFSPNITGEDGEAQRSSSVVAANRRVSVWA
jgi:flagellar hook-length control protein FliK